MSIASTKIYANTLASLRSARMDGERMRRLIEARSVAEAFKMLGDYGYDYAQDGDIDGFIVGETNKLIEFIVESAASEKVKSALLAPFWYNNVKLAYKSKFVAVPVDAYYALELDAGKIALGDYGDCDPYLAAALTNLDAEGERNPREIDLAITRAMYKHILSCGEHSVKKLFKAEIDMKNILTAARLKRLGATRDEFIDGGSIKKSELTESVTVKNFAACFSSTSYADMAEELEKSDFSALQKFESETDDFLFFMTDSLCAKITSYEPYLNYYIRALTELKTVKTALVCIKTDARETFYSRLPHIYG